MSFNDLEQSDTRNVNLGGFQFWLQTSPIDGRPWSMKITETLSNVSNELDQDLIFTGFLNNKKIKFSLRHNGVAEATFSCEAQ